MEGIHFGWSWKCVKNARYVDCVGIETNRRLFMEVIKDFQNNIAYHRIIKLFGNANLPK